MNNKQLTEKNLRLISIDKCYNSKSGIVMTFKILCNTQFTADELEGEIQSMCLIDSDIYTENVI